MKKRKGIITLTVLLLLLAGLIYTAWMGIGSSRAGSASGIRLGLDLAGGVSITYQAVGETPPSVEDMADTIYKLQKRVEGYSTEAQVYQEGEDRINIEIPGVSDANQILEDLGKPGSLYFIAERDSAGEYNYTGYVDEQGNVAWVLLKEIDALIEDGSVILAGNEVQDARAGSFMNSMQNQEFGVDLTLTPEGTEKFAQATAKAVQTGESIAIYYDGTIVSAPSVGAAITDGKAQITGNFTFESAESLASTIRIGGLKLELEELRSNVVGAQLGSTAISTSLKAGAVGFVLVILFMIGVYHLMGLAASWALAIYTALIVVALNLFEITLTLPGIAGIILSIGMAVDANVIIFSRIREELAAGISVQGSIRAGFSKALGAIIDGNVTTLLAAAVLGLKGTGMIKGFAQTLALGIVLSMFTALVVTKQLIRSFYAVGWKKAALYGVGKESKAVDYLSKRKICLAASLAVIAAGFVMMGVHQGAGRNMLNYSLEFVGGTATTVPFAEDLSIEALDADVVPLIEEITGDGNVQTQKVAGSNEVIFKTRVLTLEEREEFSSLMAEQFGADAEKIMAETISSTISKEMQSDALVAVLIASVLMLVYIWFRFKDVRFGAGAVLALIHDVLVVLAFYAIARVSVGSTFIACMLTIVGYSINATIVIFDRIRENQSGMRSEDQLPEIINKSLNQTLSRSIFTSLTTFIMVAVLYVFGVSSIREFALPLMVGIICGTYSSIFLSASIWYILRQKFAGKAEEEE